jgi:hypothetical protein
LTVELCRRLGKPHLVVDLDATPDSAMTENWLRDYYVKVLNVAGPRESSNPGIHEKAVAFLRGVFSMLMGE